MIGTDRPSIIYLMKCFIYSLQFGLVLHLLSFQVHNCVMFECITCKRHVLSFLGQHPDHIRHHTLLPSPSDSSFSLSGIKQWFKTDRPLLSESLPSSEGQRDISKNKHSTFVQLQTEIRAVKRREMFTEEVIDHSRYTDLAKPYWRLKQKGEN